MTDDQALRDKFEQACGPVLWTDYLRHDVALVRFARHESVRAAMSMDGSVWQGAQLKVDLYSDAVATVAPGRCVALPRQPCPTEGGWGLQRAEGKGGASLHQGGQRKDRMGPGPVRTAGGCARCGADPSRAPGGTAPGRGGRAHLRTTLRRSSAAPAWTTPPGTCECTPQSAARRPLCDTTLVVHVPFFPSPLFPCSGQPSQQQPQQQHPQQQPDAGVGPKSGVVQDSVSSVEADAMLGLFEGAKALAAAPAPAGPMPDFQLRSTRRDSGGSGHDLQLPLVRCDPSWNPDVQDDGMIMALEDGGPSGETQDGSL